MKLYNNFIKYFCVIFYYKINMTNKKNKYLRFFLGMLITKLKIRCLVKMKVCHIKNDKLLFIFDTYFLK